MPFEVTAYVPSVQPGAYQAVCTAVEQKTAKDGSGDFRVWEFTLRDGSGRTVTSSSSILTTPGSKGGKWLAALLGHVPAVGETVEPVGKPCTIIVELNDAGYERVAMVTVPADAAPVSPVKPAEKDEPVDKTPENASKADPDELPF